MNDTVKLTQAGPAQPRNRLRRIAPISAPGWK